MVASGFFIHSFYNFFLKARCKRILFRAIWIALDHFVPRDAVIMFLAKHGRVVLGFLLVKRTTFFLFANGGAQLHAVVFIPRLSGCFGIWWSEKSWRIRWRISWSVLFFVFVDSVFPACDVTHLFPLVELSFCRSFRVLEWLGIVEGEDWLSVSLPT